MIHSDAMRLELLKYTRSLPFRPFNMTMDNGDRIAISDLANIAFDVTDNGRDALVVISSQANYYGTLSAIIRVEPS